MNRLGKASERTLLSYPPGNAGIHLRLPLKQTDYF